MIAYTQAWSFQSSLSLDEMKVRLDADSGIPWGLGDSHYHGDYLGGKPDANVSARIYTVDRGFVVNLRYRSLDDDIELAKKQISNSERILHNTVLPLILAQDITPTEPFE